MLSIPYIEKKQHLDDGLITEYVYNPRNKCVFALECKMEMYLACVVPAKQTVDKSSRDANAEVHLYSCCL